MSDSADRQQISPTQLPPHQDQHQQDAGRSLKRIARSGGANLLGSGLSAIVGFALIVLISRRWDPETAGLFFAVSSIFLIAVAVSQLGVDQGLVRFLAWNTARNHTSVNRHLVRNGVTVSLCAATLLVVAAVVFSRPLAELLRGGPASEQTMGMVVVFAVALPVAAGYELMLAITRGFSHMGPTIFIERLVRPLVQLGAVLAAALNHADLLWLAVAWTGPYVVSLVCAAAAVAHIARKRPGILGKGARSTDRAARGEFWRFTIPRGLSRMALVALQRADIALVTILAGPAEAAIYTAVTRFLVLGQLANTAIQQVSEPQLARLLANANIAGTRRVAQKLTLWSVALTWPIHLTAFVFADVVLGTLFGPDYEEGSSALRILALAMLFSTAMGPVDTLLNMAGRSTQSLVNTTTALAFDVVGCLLLVPHWGIFGAATAWAGAICLRNIMCFFQVRKSVHVTPVSRAAVFMIFATTVIFLLLPVLGRILLPAQIPFQASILGISCLFYAGLLGVKRRMISPKT
ncbi:lipopolysaccharide biosynthesis protein [Arthrobacter glacialis]|uniref:lipopolysaccharide biosynthesis protein n=1 Tax=Arthrobacter glacialis TaxID=1664 RepID=UPI000CD43423|nr:flippase [Arthrobacter glacialis]POH60683.1 hypothetical protein CVS28_03170 [Arthrobacter glacialis]